MHNLNISIGLVRHTTDEGTRWLARWNHRLDFFDFIIADRLEGESARVTTLREVSWQLNVNREKDIVVANMAQANMDFTDMLPGQTFPTKVVAAFYNVEIWRENALEVINADPANAWLSSQEICAGETTHGSLLNPLLHYLVNRSQVIQHWESSTGNH